MKNKSNLSTWIKGLSILSISFMILVFILNFFNVLHEKEGFIYDYKNIIYISVLLFNVFLFILQTKEIEFIKDMLKMPIYLILGLFFSIMIRKDYINEYVTPNIITFEFCFWTSLFFIILYSIYTCEKRNVIYSLNFSFFPILVFITFF